MNKFLNIICRLCFCFSIIILSGCSIIDNQIDKYSSDKEQCYLNQLNVTEFTYLQNDYIILDEICSNENLKEWVGYIRKMVAINENGEILLQEEINSSLISSIKDLASEKDAKYVLSFLNVYKENDSSDNLIIDINGSYHKCIKKVNFTSDKAVFDYKKHGNSDALNNFKINENNATQLINNEAIYQVTTKVLDKNQLGNYLDIIAENVTFDDNTNQVLSKDQLLEIDWLGENKDTSITIWMYLDIYEIIDIDSSISVAVKINNEYYQADIQ